MSPEAVTKFQCEAPNCDGEVTVSLTGSVSLRVGCTAFKSAYPCSRCGRLFWGDGDSVISRRKQIAFLDPEKGLCNRDMRAAERCQFIKEVIELACSYQDGAGKKDLAEDLLNSFRDHTEDCGAKQEGGQCSCGTAGLLAFAQTLK